MNADFFDSLTERVLGAVFVVSNTLGAGFFEKVYERALLREFELRGIRATSQASLVVTYKGRYVGEYFADLLVEDVLVVELKCVDRLASEHTAQCLDYLRASGRTLACQAACRLSIAAQDVILPRIAASRKPNRGWMAPSRASPGCTD